MTGNVTCPRCRSAVDELRFVPPDLLTKEIIQQVDSTGEDLTKVDGMEVCSSCLADLGDQ